VESLARPTWTILSKCDSRRFFLRLSKKMASVQNQFTTMSAAASIAPIVLWSDRCQGNLYLAGKNTFLEFYTDEHKAIKNKAQPRSASADSHFNRYPISAESDCYEGSPQMKASRSKSFASMQSTATPDTDRSASPSQRSFSSDMEAARNAELQSPVPSPCGDALRYPLSLMATIRSGSTNWDDITNWEAEFDGSGCDGYPMGMAPMMPMADGNDQEVQEPQVVKPRNKKGASSETAGQVKHAKKHDLKKLSKAAPNATDEITTLMIRGIPCSFSQEALLSLIDDAGLQGKYNFFYLPRDGNRSSNLGYAFINFVNQAAAEHCTATFKGVPLAPVRSKKSCTVSPAEIQGLAHLWKHFRNTAVSRGSRGPMFLKC